MPNNINHVVVGNETKLDLREDTVTPSTMVNGIVAHDASGVRIVGTFDPSIFVQKSGDTMTGDLECPRVYKNYDAGEYYTEYDLSSINGLGLRMYADDHSMYGAFCHQARLSSQQVFMSDGDGTIMYPITNSVVLNYDGLTFENNNSTTKLDDSHFVIADKDILRTHQSLVGGWGTAIPYGANLNTDEYCQVGRFYVGTDVTAATHTNCPTRYAYMMDVFAPIDSNLDNSSYIVREIRTRYGDKYVQYVTGSTTKTYGKWVMQLSNASDNKVFIDQITSRNIGNDSNIRQGSLNGQGQETTINTRLRTDFIGVLPNTQYGIRTNNDMQIYEIHEYVNSSSFIKYTAINASSVIFKTSSTTGYIRILMRYSDNRTVTTNDGAKLQVERGEQLSSYTPYQPTEMVVTVPAYTFAALGTETTDSAFFQAWLKRIAINFNYFGNKIIQGRVSPNSMGVVYGHMYNGVNSSGMPLYSGFIYIGIGVLKYFGTLNGTFYLRSVNYTSEV